MMRSDLPMDKERVYAGFWIRLCAALIDGVLVLPLVFLCIWVGTFNKHTAIMITFCMPVLLVYVICFNAVCGGTPGKLITGIRIIKPDGTAIGWSEAFLRSSVEIVFGIVMLCIEVWAMAQVNGEQYSSISFAMQRQLLQSYYPVWFPLITGLYNIWVLSQPVVLLLNKRKKATHDFIARTVVIYKDFRK
jgi:uncharacterized RDD family membrane protein YckC